MSALNQALERARVSRSAERVIRSTRAGFLRAGFGRSAGVNHRVHPLVERPVQRKGRHSGRPFHVLARGSVIDYPRCYLPFMHLPAATVSMVLPESGSVVAISLFLSRRDFSGYPTITRSPRSLPRRLSGDTVSAISSVVDDCVAARRIKSPQGSTICRTSSTTRSLATNCGRASATSLNNRLGRRRVELC